MTWHPAKSRVIGIVLMCFMLGTSPSTVQSAGASQGREARDPLPVNLIDDDPRELRSDLEDLADAWGVGGGELGYPFWDHAYRMWMSGRLASSRYKPYAVSYRQLLVRAQDDLARRRLRTDGGQAVRDMLVDALDARIEALQGHADVIDRALGRRLGRINESASTEGQDRQRADELLQQSYRLTREAMNRSQGQLELLGGERIYEGSFL